MKREVKYWIDGDKLTYKQAKKRHPEGFDARFYTIDYVETLSEKRNKILPRVLFWLIEISLSILTAYLFLRYCL